MKKNYSKSKLIVQLGLHRWSWNTKNWGRWNLSLLNRISSWEIIPTICMIPILIKILYSKYDIVVVIGVKFSLLCAYSLWQLDMAGMRKLSDPERGSLAALCRGSRGLPKCPDRKGLCPKANAWNCCCCPKRDSTAHQLWRLLRATTTRASCTTTHNPN